MGEKTVFFLILAGMIVVGLYVSGCSTMPPARSGNDVSDGKEMEYDLAMASQLRFNDLPVPDGFLISRENSFIFQNNLIRMGTLNYTGSATFDDLINFYKKFMPLNGWSTVNSVEFGKVMLSFEKGGESCVVTLEKRMGNKAAIILTLSPLSRTSYSVENNNKEKTTLK